jgi:NADH dehydrogenase FAD-containing subunit
LQLLFYVHANLPSKSSVKLDKNWTNILAKEIIKLKKNSRIKQIKQNEIEVNKKNYKPNESAKRKLIFFI